MPDRLGVDIDPEASETFGDLAGFLGGADSSE